MGLINAFASRYIRVIAMVALLLGLGDAARLLGVTSGATSPIVELGMVSYAYLTVFCLARLFSAVGLWIKASWGAVLLGITTAVELMLYFTGTPGIDFGLIGLVVRVLLLLSVLALLALAVLRLRQARD